MTHSPSDLDKVYSAMKAASERIADAAEKLMIPPTNEELFERLKLYGISPENEKD